MHLKLIIAVVSVQFMVVSASTGDRSPYQQSCVKTCVDANCTEGGSMKGDPLTHILLDGDFTAEAASRQQLMCRLLRWGCKDECDYECMWETVKIFEKRGFDTPKFHGKWPFIRVLGIQEPASAFASLCNLVMHVYMYRQLWKKEYKFYTPMMTYWNIFATICIHAWFWSTVFHTRDTPLTEFMDYASALSMVMSLTMTAILRILHKHRVASAVFLFPSLSYFVKHVEYLYAGDIDYEFNMGINVLSGVSGSLMWMAWAMYHAREGNNYVNQMIAFTILSGVSLSLELTDFPPLGGFWDAHALWHMSTAPLPLLFYRFIMDDLDYLEKQYLDYYKIA